MLMFSAARLSNILYDIIIIIFLLFVSESWVENRPRSSVDDKLVYMVYAYLFKGSCG